MRFLGDLQSSIPISGIGNGDFSFWAKSRGWERGIRDPKKSLVKNPQWDLGFLGRKIPNPRDGNLGFLRPNNPRVRDFLGMDFFQELGIIGDEDFYPGNRGFFRDGDFYPGDLGFFGDGDFYPGNRGFLEMWIIFVGWDIPPKSHLWLRRVFAFKV